MDNLRQFMKDDDGMGVVEVILIIVVLISLVLIFKKELTEIVKNIFGKVSSNASQV